MSIGWGPQAEVPPSDYEAPAAGWTSTDRVTWQAGPPSGAICGLYGDVVAVLGGFVAAGSVGLGSACSSRPMVSWTPATGLVLTDGDQVTLASDGHHVVVETAGPAGSGSG